MFAMTSSSEKTWSVSDSACILIFWLWLFKNKNKIKHFLFQSMHFIFPMTSKEDVLTKLHLATSMGMLSIISVYGYYNKNY